jgi:hypothetical protein
MIMQININTNNQIKPIQQTQKINNKQRKCPMCGYPMEENRIVCEYCEWDERN